MSFTKGGGFNTAPEGAGFIVLWYRNGMDTGIIDLRNHKKVGKGLLRPQLQPPPGHTELPAPQQPAAIAAPEALSHPATAVASRISWTTPEYEVREYGKRELVWASAIAGLFILFAVVTQNYFFIAFVLLAFTSVILYGRKTPRTITVILANNGIMINKSFYEFSGIKSFWIFERPDMKDLSLETNRALSSCIRIPLGNTDMQQIRAFLLQFIPEEQHKEYLTDEIARIFGF